MRITQRSWCTEWHCCSTWKNGGTVSESKTNYSTSMTQGASKLAQIINIMIFTETILEMRSWQLQWPKLRHFPHLKWKYRTYKWMFEVTVASIYARTTSKKWMKWVESSSLWTCIDLGYSLLPLPLVVCDNKWRGTLKLSLRQTQTQLTIPAVLSILQGIQYKYDWVCHLGSLPTHFLLRSRA